MTHHIPKPGEVVWDEDDKNWWLCCPTCFNTGPLVDHEVVFRAGVVTITPSIECECGAHYKIIDGVYQRA